MTRAPGDHSTAINAVADYHYAIITARDSARAADDVAPGNPMGQPNLISAALNGFAPGTTYCLRLRQTTPTTVLFTLDYRTPTGANTEYKMRAITSGAPGEIRMAGEVSQ